MSLPFEILKSRDFRFLMFARMAVSMALQAQAVIVGWQVYSITKDPFMLGLTGLAEAVPAIICALFSGHVVDNNRPHKMFLICLGALCLNTFMLFLFGGEIITTEGHHILPFIFAGIFISGVARSFIMPASFSLVSSIIPKHKMAGGMAWLTSGFQVATIVGPAVAGLIYGGYGARAAWMMPVILVCVSFILMWNLSDVPRNWRNRNHREAAIASITAGWKFIWGKKILMQIMMIDMFAVLLGGTVAILPAFADQVLHTGSEGLGMLRAAPAVGSILCALYLAIKPMQQIHARSLIWVAVGFGVSMIGFGLSTTFWLAMFFLFVSGAVDSISVVVRQTLMQLLTPDDMRGRVSAVNSMFIISSNEIGAFRSGSMAAVLGLVPSIILGGAASIAVGAVAAVSSRT
ncbi:MAG TPA: MFS transporter, partial [Rhodospirillaceae bacterium]|nr:MFS transporter [Rhodospirillaceae bacterium]